MPGPTQTFVLVDAAKDGKLATELRVLREEGLTLDEISRHFEAQGFPVGRETIRRWCHDTGLLGGESQ